MAKKSETEATAAPEQVVANVTVTATAHLCEAGVRYAPGDSLELTPERAAALGGLVSAP